VRRPGANPRADDDQRHATESETGAAARRLLTERAEPTSPLRA
jgi:hypothetical protein